MRLVSLLLLGGLFAGASLWSVGLIRFARAIPDDVADSNTATDAIVVLTGGSERLAAGLRLLAEHKGERVFISGVHPGVPVGDLLRVAGASASGGDPRIEMGHGARDTAGNAEETAAWVRQRGYRSLRLVTGNYHMPRSLLEFEHALPDARVIPNPVFPSRVHQDSWWRSPGTATLIISEYNKYLLAIARQRLGLRSPAILWSAAASRTIVRADPSRTVVRTDPPRIGGRPADEGPVARRAVEPGTLCEWALAAMRTQPTRLSGEKGAVLSDDALQGTPRRGEPWPGSHGFNVLSAGTQRYGRC